MKVESFKLHGFIGIMEGLGLDTISLDLSRCHGLVALSGPNGIGKTTVLDNLQPYRALASRASNLAHHVFMRDSYRELVFTLNGDTYTSRIMVDSKTGKSEAFLHRNSVQLNDGKATTYDALIEEMLGSSSLFFNSVFCAQNGKKLTDLTAGQMKVMFSEFLGLTQLQIYEETCKKCLIVVNEKKIAAEKMLEANRISLKEYEGLEDELAQVRVRIENMREIMARVESELSANMQEWKELEKKALESQNATAVIEILDHEISTFQKEIDGLDVSKTQAEVRIELKIEAIREKMQKSKELVDRGVEIETAVWEAMQLGCDLDEVSKKIQEATWKDKERRELESKMALLESQIEGDLKVLSEKIGLLDNQASILGQRPQACVIDTCLFIQSAVQAKASMEEYEAWKEKIAKGEDDKPKELAGLSDEHERISSEMLSSGMDLKALNDEKAEIERKLIEAKEIANLDPLLKSAEEHLRTLETEENELRRDHADFLAETGEKRDECVVQMKDRTSKREECVAKIDEKAISEKKRVEKVQEELREEKEKRGDEMAMLGVSESVLIEKAKTKSSLSERIERIGTKIKVVDEEIASWTYLRNACSKTGIQALEIDAAAPSISGIANDLLYATFGSKYQIKFQTVDDEGREVFNVQIRDSETGELQDLDNLSGGQKVWVLKAIRLALTTLSKQKTGMDFRTIYADEEDGSLDLDRKLDYVNMHRELLRLGGFDVCFMISHTPEVINACDTVLNFSRGGIEIVSN